MSKTDKAPQRRFGGFWGIPAHKREDRPVGGGWGLRMIH